MNIKRIVGSFILFISLFVISTASANAATYYVSTSGNDNNNGTTVNTAWKTLAKACTTVSGAGDIIHIGTGNFTESSKCILAKGVSIEGEGKSNTIVKTTMTGQDST